MRTDTTLQTFLESHTIRGAAALTQKEREGVRCLACAHRCLIKPGRTGVCRVRFNRGDELRVPGGYVSGLQIDPIEKKPFYHALPGRDALSFGMLGCDFHCPFCQNWVTSQVLQDYQAVSLPRTCTAEQIADLAIEHNVPLAVSTYNEPLITSEWAVSIFERVKPHGIRCGYVSNGSATPEVLDYLRPYVDLFKVDLKSFDDRDYRRLGGVLASVLKTIERLAASGFWVEVVTLVVPGFNDSDESLNKIAAFLAGLNRDIPWHVTAFHPEYRMQEPPRTPVETLLRAYDIGKAAGLHYVYPGNIHGGVGDRENTHCPKCGETLLRRTGFIVEENAMLKPGRCPKCDATIAGVWEETPPKAGNGPGIPRPVRF